MRPVYRNTTHSYFTGGGSEVYEDLNAYALFIYIRHINDE